MTGRCSGFIVRFLSGLARFDHRVEGAKAFATHVGVSLSMFRRLFARASRITQRPLPIRTLASVGINVCIYAVDDKIDVDEYPVGDYPFMMHISCTMRFYGSLGAFALYSYEGYTPPSSIEVEGISARLVDCCEVYAPALPIYPFDDWIGQLWEVTPRYRSEILLSPSRPPISSSILDHLILALSETNPWIDLKTLASRVVDYAGKCLGDTAVVSRRWVESRYKLLSSLFATGRYYLFNMIIDEPQLALIECPRSKLHQFVTLVAENYATNAILVCKSRIFAVTIVEKSKLLQFSRLLVSLGCRGCTCYEYTEWPTFTQVADNAPEVCSDLYKPIARITYLS